MSSDLIIKIWQYSPLFNIYNFAMPYRKSFRSRRRGGGRRRGGRTPWYDRKYSTMQLARKAFNATRYLKGLVNSEMMHLDTAMSLGGAQSSQTNLCAIAQGDGDGQRTGNSLLLRSIYLRGFVEINAASTTNARCMLALVQDTQQIADTTPTVATVFASATNPETMLALGTSGRFKVIWRKSYGLTPISGGKSIIEINKYWKVYQHVRYNGSASSDIQKGSYYLMHIGSEGVNFVQVNLTSRVGYHDN